MNNMLMKCGCSANAKLKVNEEWVDACAVHMCSDVHENPPNLDNRVAYCSYGRHAEKASNTKLAFFRYRPDKPTDEYYCGCYGWD